MPNGKANEHHDSIPRDWWLEPWEKQAIIDFHDRNPLIGYWHLTFMMHDRDIVAVSPRTTYRILKTARRLGRKPVAPNKKGTAFYSTDKGPFKVACRHQLSESRWHVLLLVYFLFTS